MLGGEGVEFQEAGAPATSNPHLGRAVANDAKQCALPCEGSKNGRFRLGVGFALKEM